MNSIVIRPKGRKKPVKLKFLPFAKHIFTGNKCACGYEFEYDFNWEYSRRDTQLLNRRVRILEHQIEVLMANRAECLGWKDVA